MTGLLFTFVYVCYLLIMGIGLRIASLYVIGYTIHTRRLSGLLAHGFFIGLFAHVALLNGLQLFNLSNGANTLIIGGLAIIFAVVIGYYHFRGLSLIHKSKNRKQQLIIFALIVLASLLIFYNSHNVPNLAWDTWTVWIARAKQWYYHGLSAEFVQPDQWLIQSKALLNLSSHYPDGLSLIVYPIVVFNDTIKPGLLGLYLTAYGLLVLLVSNRLEKLGAPFILRLFLVLVMYSTPLLINHILLPGYADIWLACYILLIMLVLLDYNDQPKRGLRLTIIAYALMLPMLKLEGWAWLLIFFFSHTLIMWFGIKQRLIILAVLLSAFIFWFLLGGISLSTPWGPLNITPAEINLFNKAYLSFAFTPVTDALINGIFWQFNWSLLWFGLPFLLFYMVLKNHNKAQQVSHLFFMIAFITYLALFYLTPAAKYALDFTAVNRILLQLMPCYIFLIFTLLTSLFNPKKTDGLV